MATNTDWDKYMAERLDTQTIRNETGFACFSDHPETDSLFIRDYYVTEEFRSGPRNKENFDAIMRHAKKLGRKVVTGCVSEVNNTYKQSLIAQLKQGFKISAVQDGVVYTYIRVADYFGHKEK